MSCSVQPVLLRTATAAGPTDAAEPDPAFSPHSDDEWLLQKSRTMRAVSGCPRMPGQTAWDISIMHPLAPRGAPAVPVCAVGHGDVGGAGVMPLTIQHLADGGLTLGDNTGSRGR